MNQKKLICIEKCRIENEKEIIIQNFSWCMCENEVWLVIGPNGGGKADFMNALSHTGNLKITPNSDNLKNICDNSEKICQKQSLYSNIFADSVEIVSLERAAKIIQEERENDESEFMEGGVDIGRTGRVFIAEGVLGKIKKGAELPPEFNNLEEEDAVKLCGIEKILERGIKYMSTGEIRRTLLARALLSGKKLLVLSDPFAGLDVQSRSILLDFFNKIALSCKNQDDGSKNIPHIILAMERWNEIPEAVTNVLEFSNKSVSFCGTKTEYEELLKIRNIQTQKSEEQERIAFSGTLTQTLQETKALHLDSQKNEENEVNGVFSENDEKKSDACEKQSECQIVNQKNNQNGNAKSESPLIEMNDVNVGWGENVVLKNLNWTLNKGEHWLVRGPNGSGKTTFLELITGDNKQVFCNDIKMFGRKRGTGESIWDIKKQLGIVSYRLHVEYRMVGNTSLQNVIVSGFRDSIGLYGAATDVELSAARKWLALGGFKGRECESFGSLSYGEQRAILILRSAVKCPKILILDEPCHGLDEQYRNKILQLMEEIALGGTTTLLHVTHDPTEVLDCEKHILELHPGENPMYTILLKD